MEIFYTGITTLIFGAFASLFFKKEAKLKLVTFFTFISSLILSYSAAKVLITNKAITSILAFNKPFGDIAITIDSLSAFFILIISIMGILATIYANGYLKPYLETNKNISSHCFFLMMLIMAMTMVCAVQNALFFLVAWEVMSISSFFLVAFEGNKKEVVKASIKYLVYMHISLLFIMLGFIFLNIKSGTLDFNGFKEFLLSNKEYANLFFGLTFVGFSIKAGFVPFHNWLPQAHPMAPSHISALMSGVMIKTGIYGILRMLTLINVPDKAISYSVLFISVITALYGVLYTIAQQDLKKLLAYCSIENIGIIGIGLSIGMLGLSYNITALTALGFLGCILHILNHSIFKMLLFMGAGSVYLKTHTKDIEQLGGLFKKMPFTALFFLIGSIAICGLPPLNGFISEIIIYFSMLKGILSGKLELFVALIISLSFFAYIGTMALLAFTKAFSITFLGNPKSEHSEKTNKDVEKSMLIPMGILAIGCISIGILPKTIVLALSKIINIFNSTANVEKAFDISFINQISNYALWFFLTILIFIGIRILLHKRNKAHSVWGCGYDKPNNKMQYSASSFVAPFLTMAQPLFAKKFDVVKPNEIFPKDAHFSLEIKDIEEEYIIKPIIDTDREFLSKFQILQSGNLQQYILFGLIFLILMLIGVGLWG